MVPLKDMKRFESPHVALNDRHRKSIDINHNMTFGDKTEEDAGSQRVTGTNLKINLSSSPPKSGLCSPGSNRRFSLNDFKMEIGGLPPKSNELITRSPSPRLSEINAIINGSHVSPRSDDSYKQEEKDANEGNCTVLPRN